LTVVEEVDDQFRTAKLLQGFCQSSMTGVLRRSVEKNTPKKEHPHRDLSTALRFGRDDKGEGSVLLEEQLPKESSSCMDSSCRTKWFVSNYSSREHITLPFVISTGAQRSGEISV
jgi:hypothetical protein